MVVLNLYLPTTPGSGEVKKLETLVPGITLLTETCYNVETFSELTPEERKQLLWILSKPFENSFTDKPGLQAEKGKLFYEFGPRLNFSTPFSTNAVSICANVGLEKVTRIEPSRRYLLTLPPDRQLPQDVEEKISLCLHDRMTECLYATPIQSFALDVKQQEIFIVDVLGRGKKALEEANRELGLAFDDWDIEYYTDMFINKMKRNPTSVEAFDLAQSNSEHSRHWFFKGRLVVDGTEQPRSLLDLIMATQKHSKPNNLIKFNDNSSAIEGHRTRALLPWKSGQPSPLSVSEVHRDIIFTAETHNFPTGVAPFPGATTGTGGRIRDVHATGRGAHVVAGTAGYCFGNLLIPGYCQMWERRNIDYPENFASPLTIAIEASNGASDYGNKFGEPVLAGFARSCGIQLSGGLRREYIKPIMFSGGIGTIEHAHLKKEPAEKDMLVVKLGGPAYRIGVGGGAASSMQVQGDNKMELDFGAVQRGDAEMEQKLNRIIRACVELGSQNPICSIHDQGAGGNGNVLKEIVDPAGAVIHADRFGLGDPTLSIMELWGAEYQESDACLVRAASRQTLAEIGSRERCPIDFVGTVTGSQKIQLEDFSKVQECRCQKKSRPEPCYPVDLDLSYVLSSIPRKVFPLERVPSNLLCLTLPVNLQVTEALANVLRLPAVASKRWLTNKVDRSVTGLVAQQQCVGPLHTPLADVAVVATSHFDTVGAATAIGEQPMKGLVDAASGAKMSVAEAITNLAFAPVTALEDVKCSGNWMWPAKLLGEGALLYDACRAMCQVMGELGIAVDGGKDSLSMAARNKEETCKAPGTLVVSAYVGCPDITGTVTPDFKCPEGKGCVLWVRVSKAFRLGGSALAQCYGQIGAVCPDLDEPKVLAGAFKTIQTLLAERLLTAGHDISDGGLVTCLLEMAFAGNCGFTVSVGNMDPPSPEIPEFQVMFAEELGFVLETKMENAGKVMKAFEEANVCCLCIGASHTTAQVKITLNEEVFLQSRMVELRDVWEATSFQLERLQTHPSCVKQEESGLKTRKAPAYAVPFTPSPPLLQDAPLGAPKVAVIREEGSNGDREMAAAFKMAGFEVWDVNMEDLISGRITLEVFRGLAFVGGFSYADVCGSAKGWAAAILLHDDLQHQFAAFRKRPDTFSLGICNGCQLMALIGWVGSDKTGGERDNQGVFLDHNVSERYESRWATVKVAASPAIMLAGMEGTVFGVWVAHGEGRMRFKQEHLFKETLAAGLAPVRYVDDHGQVTMTYPHNPNGSPEGIAALCSPDGRHLAMMPHPERCFLTWQCPWVSPELPHLSKTAGGLQPSPWLQLFHNAYSWCQGKQCDSWQQKQPLASAAKAGSGCSLDGLQAC